MSLHCVVRRLVRSAANLRSRLCPALLFAVLAACTTTAWATPITYTLTGNFTGTLGSTTLSGPVVFSLTSDTSNVRDLGGYTVNTTGTSTIAFNGLLATFLAPTFGVEAEYFSAAFVDTGSTGNFAANAFAYDIPADVLSRNGLSYTGDYLSLLMGSTATSRGALTITGVNGSTTFSTSALAATPEPSSLLLLGTGLLGTVTMLRRRLHPAGC